MADFGTVLTVYQSVAIAISVECEYGFECSDNGFLHRFHSFLEDDS